METEDKIYDGLHALERPRYLAAMWLLCGELQSLYREQTLPADGSLMSSTLEVVLEALDSGSGSGGEGAVRAAELDNRWRSVIDAGSEGAQAGLWNAWVTFQALAAEIAGSAGAFEATERLANAATERWRDASPTGFRWINPNEEIDDDSPMARTLRAFEQVVTLVAESPGVTGRELADIRSRVFGEHAG